MNRNLLTGLLMITSVKLMFYSKETLWELLIENINSIRQLVMSLATARVKLCVINLVAIFAYMFLRNLVLSIKKSFSYALQ